MSPFSPNYQPKVTVEPASAKSRQASRNRDKAMKSDDVEVRIAATGYLGPLSTKGDWHRQRALEKPSNL